MVTLLVVLALIISLFIILIGCEIFTNGIEWLGMRLGLAETATGSILAAVGTAMPETIVPLIVLGTLAMFIGGITIWWASSKGRRQPRLQLRKDHAERDMKYFMTMYCVALLAGVLGQQHSFNTKYLNYGFAGLLMVAYGIYLHRTLKDERTEKENTCAPLYLCRAFGGDAGKGHLGFTMIVLQVVGALIGIIIGAKFFVDSVSQVASTVGISPIILSFLIAPIATELPEKFNSGPKLHSDSAT